MRIYLILKGSPDSGTSDPSVRFSNGENNCDIVFDPVRKSVYSFQSSIYLYCQSFAKNYQQVSPSAHSSTWKCHLADTDLEAGEQVKAEALIRLRVAQQVKKLLVLSSLERKP